jgi:hypothetical protein
MARLMCTFPVGDPGQVSGRDGAARDLVDQPAGDRGSDECFASGNADGVEKYGGWGVFEKRPLAPALSAA